MFDLLIQGTYVVDVPTDRAVALGVRDVAVENGRIVAIESPGTIDPGRAGAILDAHGLIALPALVNAHAHAAMTLFRGTAEDVPFERWFSERIRPLEAHLTPDDVYWGTTLAIAEMFEAGIGTVADHYFYVDDVARAIQDAGMRATLSQVLFGTEADARPLLEETRRLHRRWDGAAGGRIRVWVGPHSHYACDESLLRTAAVLAGELNTGVHLHLAEEPWQVEQCRQTYGIGPVALLERTGLFDRPALCAHAVVVDDAEAQILADHGAAVATCPKTYLRLAMGNTPVTMLRAHGVTVGVGSDGAASNATLDIWEQQRLAGGLQKVAMGDAAVAPPAETLAWATAGGARAVGWGNAIGRIAPGYLADVMLVDSARPHLTPAPDIVAALAGACRPGDVRHLFVQGVPVLRDGHLLTIDKARAMAEVSARADRLRAARLQQYL